MENIGKPSSRRAPRILVFTTDHELRGRIVKCITENGMEAAMVATRRGLFRVISAREPDVVILDRQLDGDDGLDVLKELRRKSFVPIILLTCPEDDDVDLSMALNLGADDCLLKPFGHRTLLARLRALLRRRTMDALHPPPRRDQAVRFDGWLFEPRPRRLTDPTGTVVRLTKSEFALLSAFVRSPGRPLSREHLLQATRVHEDVFDRSMDVQILRLRRKLAADPSRPSPIRTVRGQGYAFVAHIEVVAE
jgi:two-component system OmpR family response regulator